MPRPVTDVFVKELSYEAESVVSVRLMRADGLPLPRWQPGAHIDLLLPVGITRQYSIIESAPDLSWYRIAVLQEPASRGGSEYVHIFLRPGQQVGIRDPLNHFALLDAEEYLFIAGGIGITPIIAMIAHASSHRRRWILHYGGRALPTMAFRGRVERYPDQVSLWPADRYGPMPLADIIGEFRPGTRLYCCGPAGLLEAAQSTAAERGWPGRCVHIERFRPRTRPSPAADRPVTVIAARSGIRVTVDAEESLLDGLARVGVHVDSSCRLGVCGTCEVRVLDGEPDHRDDVLTLDQQLAGDTMLACVSRARSDLLTLDL
jgi:ferredoxin-NADP reductase